MVLIIWVFIFGTSVYLGLDKGIQRLSNINVVLAFIFMGLILLIGPTMQIFKMEVNSIGLYASDFMKMSTYTDPFGEGIFSGEWTVFYWGWWIGGSENDFGVDGTSSDCRADCVDGFGETDVERR